MKSLLLRSLLGLLIGIAPAMAASAQVVQNGIGNTGNLLNYPSGTRIYQGGAIVTPTGTVVNPSVTVPGTNGSNTYYYPDGSRVTTGSKIVNPSGTFLTPNSPNGGLRNPVVRPVQPLPPPGSLNRGLNQ
ncbi:MAG: hypothetical protein KME42_10730 [Tildeniella nuda ZEHNDER 1965/U140]|jgi:hypothetical protein|nr:hypothetical protein [Tildeniella nuda ZEHNDER 1965/U140]